MSFITSILHRTGDAVLDRLLSNIDQRIRQIVESPVLAGYLKREVELPNATEVAIAHSLGRPSSVFVTPPQDPTSSGRIEEIRSSSYDPKKYSVLKATGYGATVTVDVWVF